MPVPISDPDYAFIALFKLLIGGSVVGDPERATEMDRALHAVVDAAKKDGRLHAAAIIESIRLGSTDPNADPAKITAMVEGLNKPRN